MSAARFNQLLKKIKPGDRVREAVSVGRLNALGTLAAEAAGGTYINGGPGMRLSHGPHGLTISLRKRRVGGGGSRTHPFFVLTDGSLYVGTVNGIIPLIGEEPIGLGGPTLSLPTNGYIYIRVEVVCTFQYSFFAFSNLVELEPADITIVTSETVLADSLTDDDLVVHKLIATVSSDKVIHTQPVKTNLNLTICPSGSSAIAVWTAS